MSHAVVITLGRLIPFLAFKTFAICVGFLFLLKFVSSAPACTFWPHACLMPAEVRTGHQIPLELKLKMAVSLHMGAGLQQEAARNCWFHLLELAFSIL